ncbi:hypothetical protein JAGODDHD_04324 [Sphingomonas paucimobilis]|uniref:hypothetical protein n=1 Tax=Sphingomonas paucimobilis TaxID=13689 RepID=UPI002435FAF9|nr:hypothetical protein [Sphingomonas paucimobilis]MDG5973554.1 hypothetical protein [Sphingomonas paucimobilis]
MPHRLNGRQLVRDRCSKAVIPLPTSGGRSSFLPSPLNERQLTPVGRLKADRPLPTNSVGVDAP